jgi:hypothetical protein
MKTESSDQQKPLSDIDRLTEANDRRLEYLDNILRTTQAAHSMLDHANDYLKEARSRLAKAIANGSINPSDPIWSSVGGTAVATGTFVDVEKQPILNEDIYVTMADTASSIAVAESIFTLTGEEPPVYLEFSYPVQETTFTELTAIQQGTPPNITVLEAQVSRALHQIDPTIAEAFEGAWETFRTGERDKNRQASHSMREVIYQLFRNLAPDDKMSEAGIKKKTTTKTSYHLDQRKDFLASSYRLDDRQKTFLENLYSALNKPRRGLNKIAHLTRASSSEETEADMTLCTNALWQLLVALGFSEKSNS